MAEIEKRSSGGDAAIVAAYATRGYSYQQIVDYFGVHFTTVGRVVRGGARSEGGGRVIRIYYRPDPQAHDPHGAHGKLRPSWQAALHTMLAQVQTELNLQEGEYEMWIPDMPDVPPQSPAVVMIAKADQAQSSGKKAKHILGVCKLVKQYDAGEYENSVDISPDINADTYFWFYATKKRDTNFGGDARVKVVEEPKHGILAPSEVSE
ncbi:MAG: hypothetical protein IDH49_02270 [Gammaproteobacteria bacterium]|nr:hypothetical protein [Gammaproteobacteria bacterium]